MLPQLVAQSEPRRALLARLFDERAEPPVALLRIGALHAGQPVPRFRTGFVAAGGQVFPHPDDVPALLAGLMAKLHEGFVRARTAQDDLHLAAFAAYGGMAIHPFENGNGRAAVDFAQYLLMIRWRRRDPPCALVEDAHRVLGQVFAPLDEKNDGTTAEGFLALTSGLARRIAGADLPTLARTPAFAVAARWLELGVLAATKRREQEKKPCPRPTDRRALPTAGTRPSTPTRRSSSTERSPSRSRALAPS